MSSGVQVEICKSGVKLIFHRSQSIRARVSKRICAINSLSLSPITRTHYESIMHPRRVYAREECVKYSAKLMAKFKLPEALCGRNEGK